MPTWKERLADVPFTITTGDGKQYTPQMTQSVVELTFNSRDFLYLNIDGTYVGRKNAQGEVFPLEFWFTGDDHIDTLQAFLLSTKDNRAWTISHPFYDELTVQVSGLRAVSNFNQTIVTAMTRATLPKQLPEDNQDLSKDIENLSIEIEDSVVNSIEPNSVVNSQSVITSIGTNYSSLPNSAENVVTLKDKVRTVTGVVTQVLDYPVQFNDSLKALLKFPLDVETEVRSSLNSCKAAILDLVSLASTDPGLFDLNSTILITSSMNLAIAGSYNNISEVIEVQSILVDMYETQRETFESIEYEPENEKTFSTSVILAKSLGRLNQIAFSAKQERIVNADRDGSPILFCHRYYGTSDDNLERFIRENNLTIDEHLQIKQGRELVYYV